MREIECEIDRERERWKDQKRGRGCVREIECERDRESESGKRQEHADLTFSVNEREREGDEGDRAHTHTHTQDRIFACNAIRLQDYTQQQLSFSCRGWIA